MRFWSLKLYSMQSKNQSAFYFSKKSWHDSFNLTSRTNNQYFGAGDDVMARLERVLKSQYVTNQARNIVRYFANINQDGFVFLTSQDIAEGTDLAKVQSLGILMS